MREGYQAVIFPPAINIMLTALVVDDYDGDVQHYIMLIPMLTTTTITIIITMCCFMVTL